MAQILSFDLRYHVDGDGVSHLVASALADGVALDPHNGFFFDIGSVLALRDYPMLQIDLFTCSCGVSGCAGIHEGCRIEVTDELVTWVIPESVRKELRCAIEGDGELLLKFSREQYLAALSQVLGEVNKAAPNHGRGINIWPGYHGESDEGVEPLEKALPKARERMVSWEKRNLWRERVWGEYLRISLELELPNGYVASIPLENLADVLGGMDCFTWDDDDAQYVEDEVVPALKAGLESIVEQAKSVEWSELVENLFMAERSPKDSTLAPYYALVDWPEVKFSLSTGD